MKPSPKDKERNNFNRFIKEEFVLGDLICHIFGHKMSRHITQPENMEIEWCDRCKRYKGFEHNKKYLRAN